MQLTPYPPISVPLAVLVVGSAFVATPPGVDPLAPRLTTIPDARWATRGEVAPVDCYSDAGAAMAALLRRGHVGGLRLTTLNLRCVTLAAFDDDDLAYFGCSLGEFESRASSASQEVMSWVRKRWGVSGLVTRALDEAGATNAIVLQGPDAVIERIGEHHV